jgi:hypothetical protein
MNSKEVNEGIWQLWNQYPRQRGERVPKFVRTPEEEHEGNLVFLGLNPSFPNKLSEEAKQWISKNTEILTLLGMDALDYPNCFEWKRSGLGNGFNDQVAAAYAAIHHGARHFYGKKWFKRLNEVARRTGNAIDTYGHVDLFLALNASFKRLAPEYHDRSSYKCAGLEPKNFIQSQLDITYKLLFAHKPKHIVAVYRSAAEIFLEYHQTSNCEDRNLELQAIEETDKQLKQVEINMYGRKVWLHSCCDLPGRCPGNQVDYLVDFCNRCAD